jgi:hypothetical protein
MSITDGHRDHPQSTPDQPSLGESNFGDSSGPLFSMYSKAAEEEDNKMAKSLQKDADGILIFVSPRVDIQISLCIKQEHYSLVYSLPQSLRSFPLPSRT